MIMVADFTGELRLELQLIEHLQKQIWIIILCRGKEKNNCAIY
jgi:hypothetical protein